MTQLGGVGQAPPPTQGMGKMPYSQFDGHPLGPDENRWVRGQMYRQENRKRLWQAWLAIPPLILTIFSIIGTIAAYISGLFH